MQIPGSLGFRVDGGLPVTVAHVFKPDVLVEIKVLAVRNIENRVIDLPAIP